MKKETNFSNNAISVNHTADGDRERYNVRASGFGVHLVGVCGNNWERLEVNLHDMRRPIEMTEQHFMSHTGAPSTVLEVVMQGSGNRQVIMRLFGHTIESLRDALTELVTEKADA